MAADLRREAQTDQRVRLAHQEESEWRRVRQRARPAVRHAIRPTGEHRCCSIARGCGGATPETACLRERDGTKKRLPVRHYFAGRIFVSLRIEPLRAGA